MAWKLCGCILGLLLWTCDPPSPSDHDRPSSRLAFSNSIICLLQSIPTQSISRRSMDPRRGVGDVRRLGNTRSGSGMRVRTSRSEDSFQAKATMPAMTATITAVLAFQLCGCAYQPPDGDHTCLGYLWMCERRWLGGKGGVPTEFYRRRRPIYLAIVSRLLLDVKGLGVHHFVDAVCEVRWGEVGGRGGARRGEEGRDGSGGVDSCLVQWLD